MAITRRRGLRVDGVNGEEESNSRVWFTGVVETLDVGRSEITIRTERGMRTIRSRKPFPPTMIRPGDQVTVSFNGKDRLRVSRS